MAFSAAKYSRIAEYAVVKNWRRRIQLVERRSSTSTEIAIAIERCSTSAEITIAVAEKLLIRLRF